MKTKRYFMASLLSAFLLVTNLGAQTVLAENDEAETDEPTEEIIEEDTEQSEEAVISEEEETEEENTSEAIPEEEQTEETAPLSLTKTADVDGIKVTAEFDADAFDGEVELSVKVIDDASDEYKDIEDSLTALKENEDAFDYDDFVALNISFLKDGEETEPSGKVNISIELEDKPVELADSEGSNLVHIDDEGTAEIVTDADISESITEVSFSSEDFSNYVLTWLNAEQTEYEITDEVGEPVTPVSQFLDIDFTDELTGEITTFTFYFDENGQIVKNQENYQIEGKYYAFDEEGHLLKNVWSQDENQYFGADGARVGGQKKVSGFWYYFDETTGNKVIGLKEIPAQKKTVYYNADGKMHYGEKKIDGYWYFFKLNTGGMVKSNFAEIPDKNKTCYYDANGHMVYGFQTINKASYYFNEKTGAMFKGIKYLEAEKKTVCYGSDGKMATGEQKVKGKWYYFDPKTYNMVKGWVWLEKGRKSVYYKSDGTMAKGTVSINGIKHTFDKSTGKGTPEVSWVKKNVGGYRPWYIRVNTYTNVTTVYTRDYNGEFNIPVKAFICTTGRKSNPTPAGISYAGTKYRWYYNPIFDLWNQYCTFFGGGKVMFHSLAYETQNRYDMRVSQWSSIGRNASSGCVRMYVRDTKWIYDNIPAGVTVKTFKGTKADDRLGKPAKLGSLISGLRWDLTDVR